MLRSSLLKCVGATLLYASLCGAEARAAAGDLYISSFNAGTVSRQTGANPSTVFADMLAHPAGLAFDRAGNLFVAEGTSNRILKITPTGDSTPFAQGLNGPQSVAFDSSGNLYSTDLNGNVVYKFTPDGTRTTFASGFNGPSGLAFNNTGDLFVSEVRAGKVDRIAPNGTKTQFASGLDLPTGVAVDHLGNVFIAEFGRHRVIKFAPDGTPLSSGVPLLNRPFVLLFDSAGNLLIADNASGVVYSFSPSGDLSAIGGDDAPAGLALEPPTSPLLNISTRLRVLTGENALFAGFIIAGTESKRVIIRGIGPSLANAEITDPLLDPMLELHDGSEGVIATNDDWKENEAEVSATGIPPGDDRESSIVKVLAPGSYTVIERGKSGGTGVGVVEVYDLEPGSQSSLANISTRGFVDTATNVMICGFIVGPGNGGRVLLRGIGPSLANAGVSSPLTDPTIELRDQNGALLRGNDNWKSTQRSDIETPGLAPSADSEAALVAILPPGNYTAILGGAAGGTGVGLVELYNLR